MNLFLFGARSVGAKKIGWKMYWKIWPNLILLFVSLSTKKWFVVIGWPQCAEFRFQSTDTDKSLNSMEKEFKQRIPKLFDSYDVGNYSGVERTLHSLQPLKQPTIQTFQRQESATSQIVSIKKKIENSFLHSKHFEHDHDHLL